LREKHVVVVVFDVVDGVVVVDGVIVVVDGVVNSESVLNLKR
jgi:hypothetical protein